jgi:hypothetical protein
MAVISSVVAGVAAVGSAAISARASRKAAKEQRKGMDAATAAQERQYQQTREDFQPWREQGVWALDQLRNPLENFYASPDYEFRKSEGLSGVANSFNAGTAGGNALRGMIDYSSNLAGSEFGNWYNRLFGQSEAGRGAQGTVAHAGANAANNISNAYMHGYSNLANIKMQNAENINNALNSGVSNILYANYLG